MTGISRRALLAGGLGMTVAAMTGVRSAYPAGVTTSTCNLAELNCNWQGYSRGLKVDGVDMTWATGSGSTRRYIRAQRMADFLRTKVRASIYALIECDPQMAGDLRKLMGSQWGQVGFDEDAHDRNGWLYDRNKFTPGNLGVTSLPGGGNRRLLQIGFFHDEGPMLSTAVYHLSSNAPGDRALQEDAVLDKIDGKVRLSAADLNASTPGDPDACDSDADVATLGPRYQLLCRGWQSYGYDVPSFHDYGRRDYADRLALDDISVSPMAQSTGKIKIRNMTWFDTQPDQISDHSVLKTTVDFQTP